MPSMTPETLQPIDVAAPITLTEAAAMRIHTLLTERNLPTTYGLRVFVSGGGCSGMQYGMGLDPEAREFDTVVSINGVQVFIDPTSMMYLEGARIDFIDNLMGGGFKIDNPNAVSSCGCGHSFRTADSGPAAEGAACSSGCGR